MFVFIVEILNYSRSTVFCASVLIKCDDCSLYLIFVIYKEKAFSGNPNNALFLKTCKPLGGNHQMFGIVLEKSDPVLLFSSVEK